MRAVILDAANSPLRLVTDRSEPSGDGGEIVDVTACGVCRSDLHVVDGVIGSPPIVLGHEITGTHAALGPVMVYAPWGCRNCAECSQGMEMICANATEAGLFADGGYAEKVRVPGLEYLAPLDGLDPVNAAPLACGGLTAYRAVGHGLDRLRERGSAARALIIGAGGLGQYALSYLRLLTDAEVTVLDLAADKRALALEIGAHEATGSLPAEPSAAAKFDLVLDFIGVESTLQTAAAHVARLGTLAVVGLGGGTIPFGFGAVPMETNFVASVWGSRIQLDELLDLARREPSVVRPVEVLPLEDAQQAHERLRDGDVAGRLVLTLGT